MDEFNLFGNRSSGKQGGCSNLLTLMLLTRGDQKSDDPLRLLLFSSMLPQDTFLLYLLMRRRKKAPDAPAHHHVPEGSGGYPNVTSAEIAKAQAKRSSRQKAETTE